MLDTRRLLRIGGAESKVQSGWAEGVSIERDAGTTIASLRLRLAAARFKLAQDISRQSIYSPSSAAHVCRLVVSRFYYAMYHSVRAAAYLHYGGDDHQSHSDLPQRVPRDFPDYNYWGNQLKSAREYRNQADYDPYPKAAKYWRGVACTVSGDASRLMPVVRMYLRNMGCKI